MTSGEAIIPPIWHDYYYPRHLLQVEAEFYGKRWCPSCNSELWDGRPDVTVGTYMGRQVPMCCLCAGTGMMEMLELPWSDE